MAFEDDFPKGPPASVGHGATSRFYAVFAHGSIVFGTVIPFVGCVLGPAIILLTRGQHDRGLEAEATEALNFGITFAIFGLVARYVEYASGMLTSSSAYGPYEVLVAIPFTISAAIAAVLSLQHRVGGGKFKAYNYPLTFRFVVDPQLRREKLEARKKRRMFGRKT